ncbi:MAG: hypothetical protein KGZ70_13530 [Hydrogenophaga sp.]|nr:hypothetical protein [Hydrogenophaga sp.]
MPKSTKATPQDVEQNAVVDAEMAAAEAAIADANQFAQATQQTGEHGGEAAPIEPQELSPEERAQVARQIARRQRKYGAAELERQYPSAIVVNVDLKLNDPNIASSASRFLGLTDRTLYLINRFGSRFMSDVEVETTRASIRELIEAYALEARQAVEQGEVMVAKAKESNDDWLSPCYTSSTLEAGFGVKARDTMTLVRALRMWDEAILHFASLEFNDGATIGQIDTMRLRERNLFLKVNRQCIRAVRAFNRRRAEAANKRSGSREGAAASSEHDAGAQSESNTGAETPVAA